MPTTRRSRFTYLAGTLYEVYRTRMGHGVWPAWDHIGTKSQKAWLAVARRSEFENKRAAKVTP